MTVIQEMQLACEAANDIQEQADRLLYDTLPGQEPISAAARQTARAAAEHACDRAYALSHAILLERPQCDRDALILMAHLVQRIAALAADRPDDSGAVALRAAEALLDWCSRKSPESDGIGGWALEAIANSQISFRPHELTMA